jgi:hypothetical protein
MYLAPLLIGMKQNVHRTGHLLVFWFAGFLISHIAPETSVTNHVDPIKQRVLVCWCIVITLIGLLVHRFVGAL